MTRVPLACTVRACGLPLERQAQTWTCASGHSFDIARRGYINLLQPQDRRSLDAGDPVAAVDARARLGASHVDRSLVESIVSKVGALAHSAEQPLVVADLGCGTGHLLHAIASAHPVVGVGIDLSTHAIELAARTPATLAWVVANADRRLPLLDRSIDVLLSINARRNAAEAVRVLALSGVLIMAIPAEDDLVELREAVQGQRIERDRVERLIAEHAPALAVVARWSVRVRHTFEPPVLQDLLLSTYRGGRSATADRVRALERLEVTMASELVLFRRANA